jgi:hypothetical protein
MNKLKILLALVLLNLNVFAQSKTKTNSEDFYEYRHEVGVNTTSILANMLSLTTSNNSPYGFYYAYNASKLTYRISSDLNFSSKSDVTFGQERHLQEDFHNTRISIEKHLPISKKINCNFGLDLGYQNTSSESSTIFFNPSGGPSSITKVTNNTNVGIVGPSMRLMYKINSRIMLMTETTLYAKYGKTQEYITENNRIVQTATNPLYNFSLNVPASLFLSINLK